jgi:hypothetical protein
MNFSSLGCKFKLKFELSRNFELTRFYCITLKLFHAVEPKHFECDVFEAHKLSLNKQRMFPEIF